MNIGELAAAAGVPAATVRYYEQRGLLAPAPRTRAGYRVYDADGVRRLRFIKHAQALGFSLEDIQELLSLRVTDPVSCAIVESSTQEKLEHVRERIRELRRMERTLESLLRSCEGKQATGECPVLAALADEAEEAQGTGVRPGEIHGQRRADTARARRGRHA